MLQHRLGLRAGLRLAKRKVKVRRKPLGFTGEFLGQSKRQPADIRVIVVQRLAKRWRVKPAQPVERSQRVQTRARPGRTGQHGTQLRRHRLGVRLNQQPVCHVP